MPDAGAAQYGVAVDRARRGHHPGWLDSPVSRAFAKRDHSIGETGMQASSYRTTSRVTLSGSTSAPVSPDRTSVPALLIRARSGDSSALANVFPLIYQELRRLAEQQLRHEPDGHTLSPTALVHEAYMRLVDYTRMEWTGRAHFMAVAATAMRRILVEHARAQRSLKRGGKLR